MKSLYIVICIVVGFCTVGYSSKTNCSVCRGKIQVYKGVLCVDHYDALTESAKLEHEEDMLKLAQAYFYGFEVVDKEKAAQLYLKLAETGNITGLYRVGRMMRNGEGGFDVNIEEALKWLKKGALEKNSILCCAEIVAIYNGDSESSSKEELQRWVQIGEDIAAKGDARCKYIIGTDYKYGARFPKNIEKAAAWLELAVEDGSIPAIYELIEIYAKGDIEQVERNRASDLLEMAIEVDEEWKLKLGKMFGGEDIIYVVNQIRANTIITPNNTEPLGSSPVKKTVRRFEEKEERGQKDTRKGASPPNSLY